jgi:hypothetical protein
MFRWQCKEHDVQNSPLKLKQASAVLETSPKELQNLVQFGVINPRRRAGLVVFDVNALYAAKVALFLKKALGTNAELLGDFTGALVDRLGSSSGKKLDVIVFKSRPFPGGIAVEVKVPFRELAQQLEERLKLAKLYKDLPRGRKRRGWKREFLDTLSQAAQDIGSVPTEEVLKAIRQYRNQKRQKPEVTIEPDPEAAGV